MNKLVKQARPLFVTSETGTVSLAHKTIIMIIINSYIRKEKNQARFHYQYNSSICHHRYHFMGWGEVRFAVSTDDWPDQKKKKFQLPLAYIPLSQLSQYNRL